MLLLLMFITSAMLLLYLGNSERKIFSQFPTCNYFTATKIPTGKVVITNFRAQWNAALHP